MKNLSLPLLSHQVSTLRKSNHLSQQQLADLTGINRAILSRLESQDYTPSIPQLEILGETLGFEPTAMFISETTSETTLNATSNLNAPVASDISTESYTSAAKHPLNIAVAGTGYVGLSIATLLAQHNHQV